MALIDQNKQQTKARISVVKGHEIFLLTTWYFFLKIITIYYYWSLSLIVYCWSSVHPKSSVFILYT